MAFWPEGHKTTQRKMDETAWAMRRHPTESTGQGAPRPCGLLTAATPQKKRDGEHARPKRARLVDPKGPRQKRRRLMQKRLFPHFAGRRAGAAACDGRLVK